LPVSNQSEQFYSSRFFFLLMLDSKVICQIHICLFEIMTGMVNRCTCHAGPIKNRR